jgi:hypothetical protein
MASSAEIETASQSVCFKIMLPPRARPFRVSHAASLWLSADRRLLPAFDLDG